MKRLFFLVVYSIVLVISAFAQSDCNPYILLSEGSKWEVETYNSKDKYEGKQAYEVVSVEGTEDGLLATINFVTYNKKGKEEFRDEVTFECKDGVVSMDMSKYIPSEMIESFENMKFEMEADRMSIPKELSVGQQLDDGSLTMTISGPVSMTFKTEVVDRKVESKEKVKVPAGEFEAYKLTSTLKFSGMIKMERKSVEYISEGVGVVRTESYDKSGKLESYTVMSNYSK